MKQENTPKIHGLYPNSSFIDEMLPRSFKENATIQKYKEYNLGPDFDIDDGDMDVISPSSTISIFDIVDLTFKTDGVDDKIYITITSIDTGETIFYGRNMLLRTAPCLLLTSIIVAIDDCGVNGSMEFFIKTAHWARKKI